MWNGIKNTLSRSPPIRRCGLKYLHKPQTLTPQPSPPIRRCGLKFLGNSTVSECVYRHLLYGGVDWNSPVNVAVIIINRVTSYTEVWIEIPYKIDYIHKDEVTSHTEVWIEISKNIKAWFSTPVTSHTEVWIEIRRYPNQCWKPRSHLPYGGVDWNACKKRNYTINPDSHLPYGGVDWNL